MTKAKKPAPKPVKPVLKSVTLETVWREIKQVEEEQAIIKQALVDVSNGLGNLQAHLGKLSRQLVDLKP